MHTQRAEGTARDCRLKGRARGEVRTENIIFMFVTLDVSNVSGWLKPDAAWRGLKEGAHGSGRAARVGKREAAALGGEACSDAATHRRARRGMVRHASWRLG